MVTNIFFYYLVIEFDNKVLIAKRTNKDIWQSLFQFYLIETQEQQAIDESAIKKWLKLYFDYNKNFELISISKNQQQKLTHRTIKGNFIHLKINAEITVENYFWIEKAALQQYSFPKFINAYLCHF